MDIHKYKTDAKYRAWWLSYLCKWQKSTRQEVIKLLGDKCALCGSKENLCCDHKIEGQGVIHRKQFASLSSYYKNILGQLQSDRSAALKKFQVLCSSCNVKKYWKHYKKLAKSAVN